MKPGICISGFGLVSTAGIGLHSLESILFAETGNKNLHRLPFNGQEYLFARLPAEFSAGNESMVKVLTDSCLKELLRTSNRSLDAITDHATALILGVTSGIQQRWKGDQPPRFYNEAVSLQEFIESDGLFELATAFGFRGPSLTVNTACASSLTALAMACKMINAGMAERAVVAGIEWLGWFDVAGFSSANLLSKSTCKPFDKNRDGLMLGEGAAFVLVEKTETSATPYFEILSSDTCNELYDIAKPEPAGECLKQCILNSLNKAGLSPGDIDYVNAHGTGTIQNDRAESSVYSSIWPTENFDTAISSTKSIHGHLRAAGGLVELLICAAAINNSRVPYNKGCTSPDDSCNWNCAIGQNQQKSINKALTVSRGFGGTNISMIIAPIV